MIIDGHVHVTRSGWAAFDAQALRAQGVDCAVAYTGSFLSDAASLEAQRAMIDHLADLRDAQPDAIVPLATVHPKFGEDSAAELVRAIRVRHMAGAAFNPQQQNEGTYGRLFNVLLRLGRGPIFEALRELKVPILFDCDYIPEYSSPGQLAELARRLPDSPVIMGHFGWGNMCSMCIDVAAEQGNLYMATASAPPLAIRQAVKRLGAERVIYGSDWPCDEGRTVAYELRKVRELHLRPAEEEAILGGNLRRLGLAPRQP